LQQLKPIAQDLAVIHRQFNRATGFLGAGFAEDIV